MAMANSIAFKRCLYIFEENPTQFWPHEFALPVN